MARSKNNVVATILIGLTVATALSSCDRKTVFDQYDHTPIAGWEKNDTLKFGPVKISTTGAYAENVGLRINGAYPFRGLCLIVEHAILPQGTITVDTLNCDLVDRKGIVNGRGVSFYQYSFPMKDRMFNHGDSIYIYIRHNMKREIMPGISDVGIEISER